MSERLNWLWLCLLTLAVLLVHGYHPWAEDGGLYVAGVEYTLDPSLFPHERAFVTAHLHYSIFAPFLAFIVRVTHAPLAHVLLGVYLGSVLLTLFAALRIARQCFSAHSARWTATALFAATWTLPVAGTSLLLMDPYVTARSLSTPLSLLAVGTALQPWNFTPAPSSHDRRSIGNRVALKRWRPALCLLSLATAAAFHPLMAGYAAAFVFLLRIVRQRRSPQFWMALVSAVILAAAIVQALAPAEPAPVVAAAFSRYYWFLSQWQWFEWMGLICPLLIFWFLTQRRLSSPEKPGSTLSRAALRLGLLAWAVTAVFAHERFRTHLVARMQPLRCFLLLYAVMILLLGGHMAEFGQRLSLRVRWQLLRRPAAALPILLIALVATSMFFVQASTFPASAHIEWPGRANPNPWSEAFVWSREHTPTDALFALDARYVNTEGEDAQTFRAIAERSAIPDFSKDGGEAAITPALAPEWQCSAKATQHLSELSDAERERRLRPFGVTWLVLHADASTGASCPYRNAIVKVCQW